jgi:Protein of unknown function (DUF1264)
VTSARAGKGHPLKHRVLDLASSAILRKYPVEAISTYLNGFHMYADDMGRQVEASHLCIHLRHDLHQCVIFHRNAPGARLIGIEYIISHVCFMFARMPRYTPAASGSRSAPRIPATGQTGSSRHG